MLPFIFQLPAISFFFMVSPGQNDLADVLVRFHQHMRLCCISSGKRAVDHRLDEPLLHQGPDMFAQGLRDGRLEGHRTRAQRRARDRQTLAQQQARIEFAVRAALQRMGSGSLKTVALLTPPAEPGQRDGYSTLRGVLQGYDHRYDRLVDWVSETEGSFRDGLLAEIPVADALITPISEIADRWRSA